MDYISREVDYLSTYVSGSAVTVGMLIGFACLYGWIGVLVVLLAALIVAFCFEKHLQKKVRSELREVRGDLVASTQRVLELQQRLFYRPDPNIELPITEYQLRANNLELKDRYERELKEAREANHGLTTDCKCHACITVRNAFAVEQKKLEYANARIDDLVGQLARRKK